MKYIDQINAFYEWLEVNYLPGSSRLLWHVLMQLHNRAGWAEWVTVDVHRLMSAIDVNSRKTLIESRSRLIDAGLIKYKKGRKHHPSQYKVVPIVRGKDGVLRPETMQNSVPDSVQNINTNEYTNKNTNLNKNDSVQNLHRNGTETGTETEQKQNRNGTESDTHIKTKTKTKTKTNNIISDSETESQLNGQQEVKERIDYEAILEFWNANCNQMPQIKTISDQRKTKIRNLFKSHSLKLEDFKQAILIAKDAPWLNGENDRGWRASFDWVLNPTNFDKIVEGNYTRHQRQNQSSGPDQADYLDLLARGIIDVNKVPIDERERNCAINNSDEEFLSSVIYQID